MGAAGSYLRNSASLAVRVVLYKNWDFAIYKNTRFTENMTLQLRAEFFNIVAEFDRGTVSSSPSHDYNPTPSLVADG